VKSLSAGGEIDAWCTKCRLDLGHRIVAVVHGRPKRVICMTCGSEHNYREPRGQTTQARSHSTKRGGKPTRKTTDRQSRQEAERLQSWRERTGAQAREAFTAYSTDQRYDRDQLVYHRKFGAGYVVEVLEDKKVAVMFQDGVKTLIHASG
jgi:hypothetical protein